MSNPKDDDPPCQRLASRHNDTYDPDVAAELINASHLLQFTFQQPGETYPYTIHLPGRMAEPRDPPRPVDPLAPTPDNVIYVKGWLPCWLVDRIRESNNKFPVTVSTVKAESVYCARSTFAHGLTWRSAVINGTARVLDWASDEKDQYAITEDDIKNNDKLWGLHKIVNGFIPDEWENSRSPIKKEVDLVLVFEVKVDQDASHVHVRHGFNRWEAGDESSTPEQYWQGTIPVWETYGDPFHGNTTQEFPPRVKRWFEQLSRRNKAYAIAQAGRDSFPYSF
ncbi:hypothetical protein P170DRAFT_434813 [Aspergillus steynii IBT 23096]|uniref:Uncharacterized protein n=1 Tax=Aspergillus steynii IBT 23096 TaxID=1392250 RepID=A0A2I2GJR4_9EURO|nr:uncharacterized protein P170DRAFT_434813 [Aspergillus steynii IBT 23096]PLB53097.1 hypothetical protein P170DRAFT_434813 [Aspergillus steynii IBT 23096]